ncbi:hypothetical protein PPERSA_02710 [Pseudocohnilembus persalinus]|uniref:Uncharacterized protein n=1 Tax=Pseudocohnilembus persalinus TaxID=266149 RepID=A0A0V0R5T7_PSEPJ|nr:hypothetical protein PPERSA_02710 [Pseudocohnilembus persalinus]|eukprot:KRX09838.1 hypothetical protein PPERSA_02710 [Pseudocohnilembus persalinus]
MQKQRTSCPLQTKLEILRQKNIENRTIIHQKKLSNDQLIIQTLLEEIKPLLLKYHYPKFDSKNEQEQEKINDYAIDLLSETFSAHQRKDYPKTLIYLSIFNYTTSHILTKSQSTEHIEEIIQTIEYLNKNLKINITQYIDITNEKIENIGNPTARKNILDFFNTYLQINPLRTLKIRQQEYKKILNITKDPNQIEEEINFNQDENTNQPQEKPKIQQQKQNMQNKQIQPEKNSQELSQKIMISNQNNNQEQKANEMTTYQNHDKIQNLIKIQQHDRPNKKHINNKKKKIKDKQNIKINNMNQSQENSHNQKYDEQIKKPNQLDKITLNQNRKNNNIQQLKQLIIKKQKLEKNQSNNRVVGKIQILYQDPTILITKKNRQQYQKYLQMASCAFQEYLEIQTIVILILIACYEISLLIVPEWRVKIEEKKIEQNDIIKKELTQEREEKEKIQKLNKEEANLKEKFLKQTPLLGKNLTRKEQDDLFIKIDSPEQRLIISQRRIIKEQQKNRKQILEHRKLKINIGLWILLKLMISKPIIMTILFLTAFSSFKVQCAQLDGEDFNKITVNKEILKNYCTCSSTVTVCNLPCKMTLDLTSKGGEMGGPIEFDFNPKEICKKAIIMEIEVNGMAKSRCKSTSENVSEICKEHDEKAGYISIYREPSNSKEIKGTGNCMFGSKNCRRNYAKLLRFQEVQKCYWEKQTLLNEYAIRAIVGSMFTYKTHTQQEQFKYGALKLKDDSLIELLQNGNLLSQGYSYIDEDHELWNEIRDWIYLNRTSISYDEDTRNEMYNHLIGSRYPMDLYSELGNRTWKSDDLLSAQIDQQCEVQIAVDKKVCIEEQVCQKGKARWQSNEQIIEYKADKPCIAYNYMINEKYTPIDAKGQVSYDNNCQWTYPKDPNGLNTLPKKCIALKIDGKKELVEYKGKTSDKDISLNFLQKISNFFKKTFDVLILALSVIIFILILYWCINSCTQLAIHREKKEKNHQNKERKDLEYQKILQMVTQKELSSPKSQSNPFILKEENKVELESNRKISSKYNPQEPKLFYKDKDEESEED